MDGQRSAPVPGFSAGLYHRFPRISNGFLTDPSRLRHPHLPARRCALTGAARGARARLRQRMGVGLADDLGRPVRGAGRGVAGRLRQAQGLCPRCALARTGTAPWRSCLPEEGLRTVFRADAADAAGEPGRRLARPRPPFAGLSCEAGRRREGIPASIELAVQTPALGRRATRSRSRPGRATGSETSMTPWPA